MLKSALRYFAMVPDSFYMLTCMAQIGSSYNRFNNDSVMFYLSEADKMARKTGEKDLADINSIFIAEHKMFLDNAHDVDTAKQIALTILKDPQSENSGNDEVLMIAAYTLARHHKTDSALMYLGQVKPATLSPNNTVFYYKCLAEVAAGKGDIIGYKRYYEKADDIGDSLTTQKMQWMLRDVENSYDNKRLQYENRQYRTRQTLLVLLVLCALAIASLLMAWRNRQHRRRMMDNKETIMLLNDETSRLNALLDEHQEMNDRLKDTIRDQIEAFARLVDEHRKEFKDGSTKFDRLLKENYSVKQPDSGFWSGLRSYADYTSGGMISDMTRSCPELIESDVQFLTLYCCNLPTTVIMVCMGYNDRHSVYNKRSRVESLLGLNGDLDQYIMQWKQSHGPGDEPRADAAR